MPKYFPDFKQFSTAAAANAQIVPVWRQLLADRLTPVTALELLGDAEHAFLLESVVGIEKIGRYSFIATSPSFVYQAKDGKATVSGRNRSDARATTDPLDDLQKLLPSKRYHHDPRLPNFTGGLVGYAGYDTIRYYEGEKLTRPPADDRGLPGAICQKHQGSDRTDHRGGRSDHRAATGRGHHHRGRGGPRRAGTWHAL